MDEPGSHRCPRSSIDLVNTLTGQVIPGRCRASFCEFCGPVQSWWKARIISDGGGRPPERYAVLTQAPADWQKLRQKMRDFPRLLARRGYVWEQAWTVEEGAQTGMRHVNVLQKGTYVPQAELQDVWGAIAHVQAVKGATGHQVAGYALKEAQTVAGYVTKDGRQAGGLDRHLALNGGRLVHVSRGYLGGETQAAVLERLLSENQSEGSWVVVPRGQSR